MSFDLGKACEDAARWVWDNRQRLAVIYSEVTNGVTNIKRWENKTGSRITVRKRDGGRVETVTLAPNEHKDQEMWVAWCNSQGEYPNHHVAIDMDGQPECYVYQHGANIRATESNSFDANAKNFPGFSKAGGERKMVFEPAPDRRITVRMEPLAA